MKHWATVVCVGLLAACQKVAEPEVEAPRPATLVIQNQGQTAEERAIIDKAATIIRRVCKPLMSNSLRVTSATAEVATTKADDELGWRPKTGVVRFIVDGENIPYWVGAGKTAGILTSK